MFSQPGVPEPHHGNNKTPAAHLGDVKDVSLQEADGKGHRRRLQPGVRHRRNPEEHHHHDFWAVPRGAELEAAKICFNSMDADTLYFQSVWAH